jgi:EXS family
MVEYTSPSNDSRRPLWNAVKYASSFPLIFLSAAQRLVPSDILARNDEWGTDGAWNGEYMLFRLWYVSLFLPIVRPFLTRVGRIDLFRLLAALVNSLYSFWWDVTNDWGFDLLQFTSKRKRAHLTSLPRVLVLPAMQEREASTTTLQNSTKSPSRTAFPHPASPHPHPAGEHPFGLRPHLLYPLPVYPLALFINLVLRLTWSIKLSSHLHAKAQGEGSFFIFWVEVAEVVRRWVWVFLRVEWEIVRRAHDSVMRVEESRESMEIAHSESFELVDTGTGESKLKDRHS